jgi:hypothetical protein
MSANPVVLPPDYFRFKVAYEYFAKRGITPQHLQQVGAVFGTGGETCDRLQLHQKSKFRSWSVGVYLPGWRKDNTINPLWGHGIFFTDDGFLGVLRDRRCPPKEVHPNDCVWLPGSWGTYDDLDRGDTVVICESYVKAMVVSLIIGLPAIALNGVQGWSRGSSTMIEGLRDPIWREKALRGVIMFDSLNRVNAKSRSDVVRAENMIAGLMRSAHMTGNQQMREICLARLPDPTDPEWEDWGVDDFVVANGADVARQLIRDAPEHNVNQIQAANAEYNARYIYMRQAGRICDLRSPWIFYTKQGFLDNEAGANILVPAVNSQGRATTQEVNLGKSWFKSPDRSVGEQMRFRPGEPKFLPVTPPFEHPDLNLWNGPVVEPSTDPDFMKRVEEYYLSTLLEVFPEGGEYLLQVLCHTLQKPEVRLSIYVTLLGEKGTGKNFVLYPLVHALGGDTGHAPEMTPDRYCNKFNKAKVAARVIIVNELPKVMDKELAAEFEAELKRDADANELYRPVELKGKDSTYIERCALALITTNYDPAWPIEYGERRCLALRSNAAMAQHDAVARPWGTKDATYWSARWKWLHTTGPADFLAFALQYDLSKFDVGAPPPVTSELQRLMEKGEKGYRGFLISLKRNADRLFTEWGLPLTITHLSAEHLLRLYKTFINREATVSGEATKTMGKDASSVFGVNPIEACFLPEKATRRVTKAMHHVRGPKWGNEPNSKLGAQYDCVERWLSDPKNTSE